MQREGDRIWISPTDLGVHLECAHATSLELRAASGEIRRPGGHEAYQRLVTSMGERHERDYLRSLREAGRDIAEIDVGGDRDAAAAETVRAMRAGAQVIYQATFRADGWSGRADFLERVERQTGLGGWGYEPVDTKLARSEALPHHVLQLGVYAQAIARVQGDVPEWMHLVLGSGRRESIRVREVAAYVRRAQQAIRRAVRERPPTEAYPCGHCDFCRFRPLCRHEWTRTDHLSRVALIRRDQVAALRDAGVETLAELAELGEDATVPGLRGDALATLRSQARLQAAALPGEPPPFEPRLVTEGEDRRGLARLPAPDVGDMAFDLEGDPFWEPARDLTFLFGLVSGREGYRALWGHDPDAEKAAFERLIDLIVDQRRLHPGMHVYHYSPAEPSAVKRLSAIHGTREAEVDELLRGEVFVDLLSVVRQAFVVGAEGYGLKVTERLAGFVRAADLGSGSDAVLAYEEWRQDGDSGLLDRIAAYNEEDCRATLALRDWLVIERPEGLDWWTPAGAERPAVLTDADAERAALRAVLVEDQPEGSPRWLAGELLEYHRREARPGWWMWFARLEMDEDELIHDSEAIGGLGRAPGEPAPVRRSLAYPFTFPAQNHKLAAGASAADPRSGKGVTIGMLDDERGVLTIERGKARSDPFPAALVPGKPIGTDAQRAALMRLGQEIVGGGSAYGALRGILARDRPRIRGVAPGDPIQTLDVDAQLALARGLHESHLVIQGPPGTGKTWLGARMVVDLLAEGRRVGVTAVSHKAINNLLAAIEEAADERDVDFRGARKTGASEDSRYESERFDNVDGNADCCSEEYALLAGTTWLFAAGDLDRSIDVLVIDEAGQMSLADALAAGTSAGSLILLGDPLQLPHVSQAIHPPGTGASVLEHLLGGETTVPPERGLFLAVTRRMHPAVCDFVSREFYEGRLEAHASCRDQRLDAGTGIRYIPVEHASNSSCSPEEAGAVGTEVGRLLGSRFTDASGATRLLGEDDILVVAPYNAHVRALRAALPAGVRVGTVDRFQGQEAPVVVFSMATSTGEDLPRDVGFLFSRNRLNVAVSRARCLAVLVCSPALLEARARTVEDMRLISTLCALVEAAEHESPRPLGT